MDFNGQAPRQKFTGNWKCSKCSTDITELPFEPVADRLDQLLCRDCFREKKQSFRRGSFDRGPRQ